MKGIMIFRWIERKTRRLFMDFQQHKEGGILYGREMLLPLPIVENME